jgi:hypothetical protein
MRFRLLPRPRYEQLRYGANLAFYTATLPLLLPFALLHELVHLAGFALMRSTGFQVEGVRLELAKPSRTAPPLCFSPLSVTAATIRLGTPPRWYHRASALAAAVGPAFLALAALFYASHLTALEGRTPLFYAAILFAAVMAPSRDDLRAARWSLESPTLES